MDILAVIGVPSFNLRNGPPDPGAPCHRPSVEVVAQHSYDSISISHADNALARPLGLLLKGPKRVKEILIGNG
jgi:hypothetical protein